jgi:hypothetical protein
MIRVNVGNQKYLFKQTETLNLLKRSILKTTGLITKHFTLDDIILEDELSPQYFMDKFITAIIDDKRFYEEHGKNGQSYRCIKCKGNLSLITFKCKHTSKCRTDKSKSNGLLDVSIASKKSNEGMSDSISNKSLNLANLPSDFEYMGLKSISTIKNNDTDLSILTEPWSLNIPLNRNILSLKSDPNHKNVK